MSSSSHEVHYRTRMFARVMGPYLIVIAAAAASRPSDMKSMLGLFQANPLWAWVTGSFILMLGLVTVALHPCWRGTAAVIVSVMGWLVAAEGFMLVAFPGSYFGAADSAIDSVGWWQSGAAVYVIAGLYLTYVGWLPQRDRQAVRQVAQSTEIQRAA